MYSSLRTYRIAVDEMDALMHRIDRDFAEALSQEPGFIAYQAIRTGPQMLMTISTFRTQEQADASAKLAGGWIADELADFEIERVGLVRGETMVSRASAAVLEPAHH